MVGNGSARCGADKGVAMLGSGALSCPHISASRSPGQPAELLHVRGAGPSLLFSALPLQIEDFRATMAQRLVRMLQICAGHVPSVSALNLLSLLQSSENPSLEDL